MRAAHIPFPRSNDAHVIPPHPNMSVATANRNRVAEPPTETGDVVISAYREYLRVVANCVLAVAGAWGRVLYVGVAGISLLLIV